LYSSNTCMTQLNVDLSQSHIKQLLHNRKFKWIETRK